ncbi:MAG: histidine kinase [Treponema sp.]|nr:histidine kinase [Treponema sp.]
MKYGLRRRLMVLFTFASIVLSFVMLSFSLSYLVSANLISSSYESNRFVKKFKSNLLLVENDLENYIKLKSYENINHYFQSRAKFERLLLDLNRVPSEIEDLNCEAFVRKLSESFLSVSDSAVYANRAGIILEANDNYIKALKIYSLLCLETERLNQLYFEKNISSYEERRAAVREINIFGIFFLLFTVSIVILCVFLLLTNIIHPLVEISNRANQLAARNFDVPLFEYSVNDEIGNICRALNRMIISIREYIDTMWEKAIEESELREREMKMNELYQDAKLNALQAQINPHFLFNTLNTGAQLALLEGSDKTCDFLEKVADFYRYNLHYTGQETDLTDEIKMLESYIYIMKVRFGSRFDYYTDIQYSNLKIKIPGMILQPLVENCIKHGLADIRSGGRITLSVHEESSKNLVIVSISDNGVGMTSEIREKILKGIFKNPESVLESESRDSGNGVGLSNVISRLKLFYKRDDVFDILSPESGGTTFVIKIHQ